MDVKGNLVAPEQEQVYKLIKLSNNYKFMTDYENFSHILMSNIKY
jgi:hypothetical protein